MRSNFIHYLLRKTQEFPTDLIDMKMKFSFEKMVMIFCFVGIFVTGSLLLFSTNEREQGGAGVKDAVEVCAKDASDTYAWRTLY